MSTETTYSLALKAHLAANPGTQGDFAEQIGHTQATVSRYATGQRFPNSETARRIDTATGGEVAFSLWQKVALSRFGLDEAA